MKINYEQMWKMEFNHLLTDSISVVSDKTTTNRHNLNSIIEGELLPKSPVLFVVNNGLIARDLVSGSGVGRLLISFRVVQLLQSSAFTGWNVYPVRVVGPNGNDIPGYEGLAITGRAGKADFSRARRISRQGDRFHRFKGLFFENDEWSGDDFCFSGRRVCVTQRVQDTLISAEVTNVSFTPFRDVTLMDSGHRFE